MGRSKAVRTNWAVIALFILLCIVCIPLFGISITRSVADAETVRCLDDFLKDFRLSEITLLPEHPKPFLDNVMFFYGLLTGK